MVCAFIQLLNEALFSHIYSSAFCDQFTHPQDVHPYPVQEVGEDEDVESILILQAPEDVGRGG